MITRVEDCLASTNRDTVQKQPFSTLGPASIIVDDAGNLEEVMDGRGKRIAINIPKLVSYAKALITSRCESVKFIFIDDDKRWMATTIEADRGHVGKTRALLSIEFIDPPFGLTPRELDVLTLLAAGFGNSDIADRLGAGLRTITKHVENILTKTNSWTRAAAAGLAIDRGYMRLPTPGGGALLPLKIGMVERAAELDNPQKKPQAPPLRKRPIIIGAPISLSSFAREDALEMLNGAKLAVEEINERGGVLGRELQMLTVDCDVSDSQSVLAGHTVLMEAEVDAFAAGYSTSQIEIQELLTNYRAPYLHAATMDHVVEHVRQEPTRFGHFFQVCPSDINYGPGMARFLIDLEERGQWKPNSRRLAVLQPEWRGMNVGIKELERLLGPRRWQIEVIGGLPLTNIDWPEVMSKLQTFDPSVVFLAYYFIEESIAFQRAFRKNPVSALVYTLYGPSIPAYAQTLGELAEGVIWATTTGLYSDRIAHGFAERYLKRYGLTPGRSHAGLAYDRIRMLADVWARVGNPRAFDKIAEELRTTVHRGVNGAYLLGTDGQVSLGFPYDTLDPSISKAHLVFQIQNGTHRILSPSPYADGKFRLPPWTSSKG